MVRGIPYPSVSRTGLVTAPSDPTRRTVLLVADGSGSARDHWADVAATVSEILRSAPDGVVSAVALLGTGRCWTAEEWMPNMPLPPDLPGRSSTIGPVCSEYLLRGMPPDLVVVVGTGEVFDLDDWLDVAAEWALVRVGAASLPPKGVHLREFTSDALRPLLDLMSKPKTVGHHRRGHGLSGPVEQVWVLDRTGYPMVYVPTIDSYVQLFPLSKPQLERFLTEYGTLSRGDVWYRDLLTVSPRTAIRDIESAHYESHFATGLLFPEVQQIVRWYGPAYRIPSVEQWQAARDWLAQQPPSVLPAALETTMARTALKLWHVLLRVLSPQSLLDLSLMRRGIIEWVRDDKDEIAGMGEPRQGFYPGFHTNPFAPTSTTRRSRLWGCRLLRSQEAHDG